jgi:hypothetical protein
MDTHRLRDFLGDAYPEVIRYTIEEALVDSFRECHPERSEAKPSEVEGPLPRKDLSHVS